MISMARRARTIVLVDPKRLVDPDVDFKGDDYSRYHGATVITPNQKEFMQVVGPWKSESAFSELAQGLRRKLGSQALLVTRGAQGMTLFEGGRRFHVPAKAREVFDVSGAGDTVIATLGVALASGVGMDKAVRLANSAAGIVVGKFGTAVVTPEELFGRDNKGVTRDT
jgi:rfaE bifunctional protein kinase chain/domain